MSSGFEEWEQDSQFQWAAYQQQQQQQQQQQPQPQQWYHQSPSQYEHHQQYPLQEQQYQEYQQYPSQYQEYQQYPSQYQEYQQYQQYPAAGVPSLPDPTAIVSGATNNDDDDRQAEDEEGEADEDAEEDIHAIAVYCKECETWLNGPRQWEDHKIGKKHRKNVQKARRGAAASSNDVPAVQAEETNPRPDPVPNVLTDTWLWLENAKAEKEALEKTENEVEADKVEKSSRAARR